jgi:hypothetical protein
MADPREQALNDAVRDVLRESNYDAHFATVDQQIEVGSRLFLAMLDAAFRVDAYLKNAFEQAGAAALVQAYRDRFPKMAKFWRDHDSGRSEELALDAIADSAAQQLLNLPFADKTRSVFAGLILDTLKRVVGKVSPDPAHRSKPKPIWRHKTRGTVYREIGRGELQFGGDPNDAIDRLKEGDRLVAYQSEQIDGRLWFRPEREFDDGRFEKLN